MPYMTATLDALRPRHVRLRLIKALSKIPDLDLRGQRRLQVRWFGAAIHPVRNITIERRSAPMSFVRPSSDAPMGHGHFCPAFISTRVERCPQADSRSKLRKSRLKIRKLPQYFGGVFSAIQPLSAVASSRIIVVRLIVVRSCGPHPKTKRASSTLESVRTGSPGQVSGVALSDDQRPDFFAVCLRAERF
jgi:hypothetical protein